MTSDRGSASVYVLAAAALVVASGVAEAGVGAAVVARHRAAAAADLGALAAASSVVRGSSAACVLAQQVVRANSARLAGCAVAGSDALVSATVQPAGWAATWGTARVTSRAGPAEQIGAR